MAVALAAAACPVESAHYSLRHSPEMTLSFLPIMSSQDWPAGVAMVFHNSASGHAIYFLPWLGGTDGKQNIAHTTDVTRPGYQLPSPDGGPGRLGDMDYVATDAGYDVIDRIPHKGEAAPAHILIPGLSDSSWRPDSVVKQFFDLDGCSANS
jgi:hypothetical protein